MNERTLKILEYDKIIKTLEENAESKLGRELISELKPINNIDEIEYMQKETEESLSLLIKKGEPPLYGIHDISIQLKRAEIGGILTPKDLIKISDSLRVARSLKKYIKEAKEDRYSQYPIIEELISNISIYKDIEDSINNAIISEEEISDNASSQLKSIRKQIVAKNQAIRTKLDSIINSSNYKKYLQDAIVTVREGRYVVPVKQENRIHFPGLVHDQSSSGATVFIEPMTVVELNNDLKELELKEQQEIERILIELTNMVASVGENIKKNQDILARLDFIFAKGKLALYTNSTKPILNNNGYVNMKEARHPLLEPKKVVPIDIYFGKDFNTLVITGPNTGGKTVSLKTVGLITLMAQSGLHIPADYNSHIAVFDNIYADIGDEQSIEQSLSTFSSHMTNIVDIINNLTSNSLILLDELGAGTDPAEGAALAMSILDYLHNKDVRTIATTHYSELKIYALTTDGVRNASVEFDVETLSPTYRLLIGLPGKSNAFEISKRLGLQDFIIENAKKFVSGENVEFEEVLAEIERDRRISEENRQEAEKLKKELDELKQEVIKEKQKTESMKEDIIRKAKEEARYILKNAKDESDEIVANLRNISKEIERDKNKEIQKYQDSIKDKVDILDEDLTKDLFIVKNNKPPENLKKGEIVEVLNIEQIGTVLTPPDEDGIVTVQVGIMKVNVDISTLRRVKEDEVEKISRVNTKSIMKTKARTVKNEVDLRGETLDEAILDLDKYLDDAYIAGLKEVYIIHGKGTGVLREGISQVLKGHKYIKSFRLGKYGEGGSGVTVAQLK